MIIKKLIYLDFVKLFIVTNINCNIGIKELRNQNKNNEKPKKVSTIWINEVILVILTTF